MTGELLARYNAALAEFSECEIDDLPGKLLALGGMLAELTNMSKVNPEALADAEARPRVSSYDSAADEAHAQDEARQTGRRVPIYDGRTMDNWGLELGTPIGAAAITGEFVAYPLVGKRRSKRGQNLKCDHNAVELNCEIEGDSLAAIAFYSARPGQYRSRVPVAPLVKRRYAHAAHGKAIDAINRGEYAPSYNLVTDADRQRHAAQRIERDRRILLAKLASAGADSAALELASKFI